MAQEGGCERDKPILHEADEDGAGSLTGRLGRHDSRSAVPAGIQPGEAGRRDGNHAGGLDEFLRSSEGRHTFSRLEMVLTMKRLHGVK